MTLNEYQQRAMSTCTQSSNNFNYMMLNLVGEVGELASKIAKGTGVRIRAIVAVTRTPFPPLNP